MWCNIRTPIVHRSHLGSPIRPAFWMWPTTVWESAARPRRAAWARATSVWRRIGPGLTPPAESFSFSILPPAPTSAWNYPSRGEPTRHLLLKVNGLLVRVSHPPASGRVITVSRIPYRGMTPEARETVPAGIPGTPGIPDPDSASSSVPGSVVKPAPDSAETVWADGADQAAGTDIGPIVFARARVAVMLPRPAPPRPDATPFNWFTPVSAGASSDGAAAAAAPTPGKMPKLFSAPMTPEANDWKSWMSETVEYTANRPSRAVKSSGIPGSASTCCTTPDNSDSSPDNTDCASAAGVLTAWLTALL